ncbi:kinase-like protein, partial [Clavulina sp. PMI_390]
MVHREAITHSQLDHPHIIPFLGIYHEGVDSPPITILPFMERGSLQDLLADSLIGQNTLASILVGISSGVHYLHSRRPPIIHGDLHPGNVLLDSNGSPYLCDFGLSRIRHEITRTRTIIQEAGRLRFLAPELSTGWTQRFRTSFASDIFSLAMTFLNAWSGRIPFPELRNDLKVASNLRKGLRPSIPTSGVALAPELKQTLWALLNEMWTQNPANRPSSSDV